MSASIINKITNSVLITNNERGTRGGAFSKEGTGIHSATSQGAGRPGGEAQ